MTSPALIWAWSIDGRRWHLRAPGADLALCGVGRRGRLDDGKAFDRDDIYVAACLLCLGAEREAANKDESVLVAAEMCGCWAGSATQGAPMTVEALVIGALAGTVRLSSMPISQARAIVTRCPDHAQAGRRGGEGD